MQSSSMNVGSVRSGSLGMVTETECQCTVMTMENSSDQRTFAVGQALFTVEEIQDIFNM